MASCSRFVVPELPPTPHQLFAGFVLSRMTRKAEVSQCKALRHYESPSRRLKNEGEQFFYALCASTHCLWKWPYHSKIARTGAAITNQAQDRQWGQVHRDFADNGTRHTRPRTQFMDVSLRHVPHTGILLHPPPLTPPWKCTSDNNAFVSLGTGAVVVSLTTPFILPFL